MKRKIDATDGTAYVYEFGDGKKVRLTAGKDGVSEEMICQLKRMDNRQYEKELDAYGRKLNDQERRHWIKEHPEEGVPRVWNRSLDMTDDSGECFMEQVVYRENVCRNAATPEIDRLYELVEEMPPRRREVLALLFEGYTQSEIARKLGISTSTVRDHLEAAKKFIRKNFRDPQNP